MVRSSKDAAHEYVIDKISDDCKHMCELKCRVCKICVHMFQCSCPDNVINYNICKHIHCVYKHFFDDTVQDPNIVPQIEDTEIVLNKVDFQFSTSQNYKFNGKDIIASKLEILQGLNKKVSLEEKDNLMASKYLDKLIDIFNKTSKINYQITEQVNVQQCVEKQIRFVMPKKNRKAQFPTTANMEEEMIRKALMQTNGEVLNVHTSFDHTYC